MKHLTQYSINGTYVQSQLIQLANEMLSNSTIPATIQIGDAVVIESHIAAFTFTCTSLDLRKDCDANYYTLSNIKKMLTKEHGAKVVMGCNLPSAYSQGDTGFLTSCVNGSNWYAEFSTGEWNIGFGENFFVIEPPAKRCENLFDGQKSECEDLFNCCDCGNGQCGCRYCYSCNACEHCAEKEE